MFSDYPNAFGQEPPPHHLLAARAQLAAGIVGYATGVPAADILTNRHRPAELVAARRLVMYLLNAAFGASLPQIAMMFWRNRSTVTLAVRIVEDQREDPAFDALVDRLEETLITAPSPPEPAQDAEAAEVGS